ncbi:MAG: proton-conducting transporter membrane subunit [Desulfuromonadales bacterium]
MTSFLCSLAVLLAGGALALVAGRRSRLATLAGAGGAVAGSLLGLIAAVRGLLGSAPSLIVRAWSVPGGSFSLNIDGLASFFLVPVFLLSLLCALYGWGYMKGFATSRRMGFHWFFFNLLAASMALVVTAANAVLFLAAWEVMSLSSFQLVAFEHEREEVRNAAWVYLLATHLGTALLFALFLLAGTRTGSLDFASFVALKGLSAGTASLFFFLALFGFGTKAGLFPVHVWLPDAHPAAPSHVSALMSGVMIKTGIYGILRLLTFLPPPPAWWGGVLMALGVAGVLYGIAMAAVQRDVKRCLAYSTVENVGIIFLALGLWLFAGGRGMAAVAFLALSGGLLHLWNHTLFKGLMFLGAGSLLHGAGSRDFERMGGLLRRMPVTGALLIGGSLAIAALPPLNGFVSEWLIYLGLFRAGQGASGAPGLYPLLLVGLLAFAGGMAIIVFTRLVGVALLGEPRLGEAAAAHESGLFMTTPMALLLGLCLAIGVYPGGVLTLVSVPVSMLSSSAGTALPVSTSAIGWTSLALLTALLAGGLLLACLRSARPPERGKTWGCGFSFPTPRMAYTAASYAGMAQAHLFPRHLRPSAVGGVPQGIFPPSETFSQKNSDPVLCQVFAPLFAVIGERFYRLRWLQQGRLHIYFLYIFIACALLLSGTVLHGRGWTW